MSRCPICGKYKSKKIEVLDHIEEEHDIPDGMSTAMYFYSLNHNGLTTGKCRVCSAPTEWNESAGLPRQLCGKPSCKEIMRANAVKNMIKVYNKPHLLNDWKQQEKMLANRKISGTYHWSNHKDTKTYTGKNELALVKFADTVLNIDPATLQMPGPVIPYEYDGQEKFWITDAYFEDFNLIVECKDGGTNKNMHPGFAYNREIEAIKDEVMRNQSEFNYVKVTDKNIFQLIEVLAAIRNKQLGESRKEVDENELKHPVIAINENTITDGSVYLLIYGSKYLGDMDNVCIGFNLSMDDMFTIIDGKKVRLSISNEYFNDKCGVIYELRQSSNIPAMIEYFNTVDTDANYVNTVSMDFVRPVITSCKFIRDMLAVGGYEIPQTIVTPLTFISDDNFSKVYDIPDISQYDYLDMQEQFISEAAAYIAEDILNQIPSSSLLESTDAVTGEPDPMTTTADPQYGCQDIDPLFEEVINKFNDANIELPETTDIISESASSKKKKVEIPITSDEYSLYYSKFGKTSCSLSHHKEGYFVKTHRCRSKYYESIDKIPVSAVKFVSSTS